MTTILSAKLMQETSVGIPLTSPFACREGAGKGSSLIPVESIAYRWYRHKSFRTDMRLEESNQGPSRFLKKVKIGNWLLKVVCGRFYQTLVDVHERGFCTTLAAALNGRSLPGEPTNKPTGM